LLKYGMMSTFFSLSTLTPAAAS